MKKIITALCIMASFSVAQAAIEVTLGDGSDSQPSTVFTYSNLSGTPSFNGGALNSVVTLGENSISGASGQFTVTWTPIQATNSNDGLTWTFGSTGTIGTKTDGWGVSPGNGNFQVDEVMLLDFDTSGLTLDPGHSLFFSLKTQDGDGWEVYERTGPGSGVLAATVSGATPAVFSAPVQVNGLEEFAVTPNTGTRIGFFRIEIQSTATVPDVVGLSQAAGEIAITGAGLLVGDVTEAYSETVMAGSVISQDPAGGASAENGSSVDLVVSLGSPPNRPNIVLIYVDDWSWNGTPIRMDDRMQNSAMPTIMEMPNLESMAANGMVFRNAYGSPQCTPARAAIQTGQANPRNGITVYMGNSGYYDDDSTTPGQKYYHFPVIANGSNRTFDPAAVTIPEALAPLGYTCAHIGKWHIRDGDPGDEGYVRHDGATSNEEGNTLDKTLINSYGNVVFDQGTDAKLMTQITDDGIDFMEEQVAAGQPFYLQLSHYAMHGGWECSPASRARYQNHSDIVAYNDGETNPEKINHSKDPAVFLGMAYELDLKIGEVRQKLVDLGIADNTHVIMMGDNGYRHEFFDELSGLSQPLHSEKWWIWQGGIRVPMVAEGPGIPGDSVCTANVANYDLLPTFVDWGTGNPADVPNLDGISLAGVMNGEAPTSSFRNRSLYFHYPHYRNSMPHSVMVKGNEAVVYFYETPVRFPAWEPIMYFDIGNDPGQYHNIYPENPSRAEELYTDMTNYFASVGARIPLVPNPNYDVSVYTNVSEYSKRVAGGPFIGTRASGNDEFGPTTFSEYWMDSWGVDIGSSTNDFDGDGTLNLAEYALGGDPTNGLDPGAVPTFTRSGDGFNYTHMSRNDDSGLLYTIESTPNLVSGVWTNAGYAVEGVGKNAGTFDAVTNALPVSDEETFIRLRIEEE